MATIIKKDTTLENTCTRFVTASVISYLIGVAGTAAFALTAFRGKLLVSVICLIVAFTGVLIGSWARQQATIVRTGITGEKATAVLLRSLPDEYCGFQNLTVTHDGKTSEMDLVIVGPTGVFIVETKNMNGTIVGNYDGKHWTQEKVGRGGTPYSRSFYSPIKQVSTHVYRLANYLKSKGLPVWVSSAVYFANPDSEVCLSGVPDKTPVFSAAVHGASEICTYITSGKRQCSKEQVSRIIALLNK